jgi:hypothetical protein
MALRFVDMVLSVQNGMDRLIRRLRRGAAAEVSRRRFVIVQIDGLSRAVLDKALAGGRMPFIRQLLRRHGHHLQPMSVGLPTSTPAFQIATMYGIRPADIPGFHYYSRERQSDIHFPRKGHAAWVEAKLAAGRSGILPRRQRLRLRVHRRRRQQLFYLCHAHAAERSWRTRCAFAFHCAGVGMRGELDPDLDRARPGAHSGKRNRSDGGNFNDLKWNARCIR